MSLLDVGLFGEFSLSSGDGTVARIGSSRAEKLLAYLLLNRAMPQSRRHLAYLFWPDSGEGQAQTNLRRELHRLRRLLPQIEQFLIVDDRTLGLRSGALSLDVAEFEAALVESERAPDRAVRVRCLESAVGIYRGDLLPELYEEWAELERVRLRQRFCNALESLVSELEAQRRYPEALVHARRLVRLDPLHDEGREALMRLHALNGDRAAALTVYREFESVLEQEFGMKPGAELQEAYERYVSSSKPLTTRVQPPEGDLLIGRDSEWNSLLASWESATGGPSRAVLVSGEAGIGKTRLAQELCDWVERQGYVRARAHCYRAEGRLAFSPIAEWFREPPITRNAAGLDPVWLEEVGRVLPELLPEVTEPRESHSLSEGWRRRKLFEALSRTIVAAPQPLLLLLDDAQWCDPETLEWLHYLLRFDPAARLLVIFTVRREEQADNPQLSSLLLELRRLGLLDEIAVGALDLAATSELAGQVLRRRLDGEESARLFEASEGHPLFVVEMARTGLQAEWHASEELFQTGELPRAHAVISARLSQLSPQARELTRLAATIGRAFTTRVLAQASDLDEKALVMALDELWRRMIIREHGSDEYDFSHDRIREVAYGELGPAPRRLLHRQVAEALENLQASGMETPSVQIAAHYEQSGQIARAIHFYQRGAEDARRVSASSEALRLLRHALGLLAKLPASPERDRLELALQYALSAPLNITLGYASPQLTASLLRLGTLGERLGQGSAVVASLVGLFAVNFVQGHSRRAFEVAEEAVARAQHEPRLLPESHFALGGALFSLGRFEDAVSNLERSSAAEDSNSSRSLVFGADLVVFRHCYASHCLWHIGRTHRSLNSLDLAIARAEELGDPYNSALANAYAALARQFMGDLSEARFHADATVELCERYGYAYYGAWGIIVGGWAHTAGGNAEIGLAEIDRGLEALEGVGAAARRPYYLSLRAQALISLGRSAEAGSVIEQALELSSQHQEVWWDAELRRLQGELAVATGGEEPGLAEERFRSALDVARGQGSKALELRSAVSLARLLVSSRREPEALDLMSSSCEKMAGAADTRDLSAARNLLHSLS